VLQIIRIKGRKRRQQKGRKKRNKKRVNYTIFALPLAPFCGRFLLRTRITVLALSSGNGYARAIDGSRQALARQAIGQLRGNKKEVTLLEWSLSRTGLLIRSSFARARAHAGARSFLGVVSCRLGSKRRSTQ